MSYNNLMKNTRKDRKQKSTVPQVYSLVLTINDTGVYLYTGIHNNLDDAVVSAREEAEETIRLPKGELLQAELDLWTTYDGKRALTELASSDMAPMPNSQVSPIFYSETDCRIRIENARNALMKMLVDKKDGAKLEESKGLLTPHQYRYVKTKITH